MKARVLVITGFGLNCEKETSKAFELAGAAVTQIHLNDLIERKGVLEQHNILSFIGGFSFGDHLGSGTVLAYRIRCQLGEELGKFIAQGKLIIGICNGFQIMTRLGIIPSLNGRFTQEVALHHNDSGVFRNSWVNLKVNKESPCVFTKGIETLQLPIRHGEGKFVVRDKQILEALEQKNLVCLRYADKKGEQTGQYPDNPNGSVNNIAGICSPSGRVFGLMPHPEANLSVYNHPQWIEHKFRLGRHGGGLKIFENAVDFIKYKV